jgi:hypothetical protein
MIVPGACLSPSDNVATLLAPVEAGGRVAIDTSNGEVQLQAREAIALGHKIALADLAPGDLVIKYGQCMGVATTPIARGQWVHVHNVRSTRAQGSTRK